jgi:hypothetical protein
MRTLALALGLLFAAAAPARAFNWVDQVNKNSQKLRQQRTQQMQQQNRTMSTNSRGAAWKSSQLGRGVVRNGSQGGEERWKRAAFRAPVTHFQNQLAHAAIPTFRPVATPYALRNRIQENRSIFEQVSGNAHDDRRVSRWKLTPGAKAARTMFSMLRTGQPVFGVQ